MGSLHEIEIFRLWKGSGTFDREGLDKSVDPTVPEFIGPVFAKTSLKRSFSVIENERFGLVFAKTGPINSGTRKVKDFPF
jgi:hypothetical protein